MLLPLSSLKEFLDFDESAEEIAERLTQNGIEVEDIQKVRASFEGVVCAKVIETVKHPQAERLCIAKVDDGESIQQIVCGAKNCRAGLLTALAKVGARLMGEDGPFEIGPAKLRGVESFGMLCSEKELQLSDEDEGILEIDESFSESFSPGFKLGDDLAMHIEDTILDVSLTPNLGHCNSVLGLARELSASLQRPLKPRSFLLEEQPERKIEELVSLEIQSPKKCQRYACRLVEDVKLALSPFSLRRKLQHYGLRSINNVVDISNLVLMEYGHPLHTFDFAKIEDAKIVVRDAKNLETFTTLDDKEHQLQEANLLICDGKRPVALAGIMGGQNSEVSFESKDILIESAYFCPKNIRKSSKNLKISSESSKRFERGCDPIGLEYALDYAAYLIQKYAAGKIATGRLNQQSKDFETKTIVLREERVKKILGIHLSLGEIESLLKRLDLNCTSQAQEFLVQIPSYRHDLKQEIDIIEEVARIYGYHNFDIKKASYSSSKIPHSSLYLFEQKVRDAILAEGLQELLSCNLIGPSQIKEIFGDMEEPLIEVLKPSSVDQSILRPSLLPGLLQILKHNQEHQNKNLKAFEIGKIHCKDQERYCEQTSLGIITCGNLQPYHYKNKETPCDFFQVKGMLENLFQALSCKEFSLKQSKLKHFHPGRQALIFIEGAQIGSMGELHPSLLRKFDISARSYFAQINLNSMMKYCLESQTLKEICPFPGSQRDWTLQVSENTKLEEIFALIEKSASKLLQKVSLLDIYRSSQLGKDQKNLTFRFFYQDREKTLSHETVEEEHQRLLSFVKNRF